MEYRYTNRLINETSPYLLQHAHNPVDWYPWGKEAFEKAKEEDKPVLLSIGYSACHWCHVMEKESFENEEIAGIMNRYFVNIKVDREERPEIDEVYQYALQLFEGSGGWPLTIFLTPMGKPFFGGTYYPPEERHGIKAFPDVLRAVAEAYHGRKMEIEATTAEVKNILARITDKGPSGKELNLTEVDSASSRILRYYDPSHGGFGTAPKFPNTTQLSLLLRYYKRTGDPMAIEAVKGSLRNMGEGGIYDQLGGGFHRYTVDERWQIPHFEKMLYDNALLSEVYLNAYRVTRESFFKEIAEETLNYLLRDMYHPEGGFYSSQDADSEGEEGKFFVWSKDEIESMLRDDTEVVCRFFGITEEGDFEGKNVLHIDRGLKALSHEFGLSEEEIRNIIDRSKERLFTEREKRVKPFRDTKFISGWNGLVISALIDAYQTTGRDSYLNAARLSLDFTKSHLYESPPSRCNASLQREPSPFEKGGGGGILKGKLFHVWKDGVAVVNGTLDDYAFIVEAAINMFEATFDNGWLAWAEELADSMIELFLDRERGGFYNSAADNDMLFHRLKTGKDQALPAGNGVAATDLLRLSFYRDRKRYRALAEGVIRLFYEDAVENPFNYAGLLSTAYLYLEGVKEITIAGERDNDDVKGVLKRLREIYIPGKVIYLVDRTRDGQIIPEFARGKGQKDDRVTVYICQNFTCSKPLTEWGDIERLL